VTAAQLGASWHPGCPVAPSALRQLTVAYVDLSGVVHTGALVVNLAAVPAIRTVFARLFAERFPIHSIIPISAFGGSDNRSAAADNTSAFNCRLAVAAGPPSWSEHAYGEAVDVNDVQNPYFDGSTVIPPAGAAYRDRADRRPGMVENGAVAAFYAVGWGWGGVWSTPDYQHFSVNGH
jgi:D-alanyl-D-alanine carboxypeptidase